MENVIYTSTIKGGGMWSNVIKRGKTLRLTDIEGGTNVSMLLYNADQTLERFNMPDTLKGQHIFNLTSPFCLHSDMGRIFASITADSVGWHDCVCGCSDAELVSKKYGENPYQTARNDFYRNGRENFLIEMEKWGLGPRDLVPNLNFFSKVVADLDGNLAFSENNSAAGDYIDLRFEMDSLVILNTCQHPLDPSSVYQPKPVQLSVSNTPAPTQDDPCRTSRPENGRAMTNTENYYLLRS
ncbi:MAG: urea amidolyase associated protein UAAP1 [Akkermansiaceae bacterium]